MERKNLKVHADVHQRLRLHADVLKREVGELANSYLYEAMRIAERTHPGLHWLTNWEPSYVEQEATSPPDVEHSPSTEGRGRRTTSSRRSPISRSRSKARP